MSRYEWESGSLIIPAKEWSGFKRILRETHNRLQTLRYEIAISLSQELKVLGLGKRNFDFESAAEQLFHKRAEGIFKSLSEDSFLILQSMFPNANSPEVQKTRRPVVPKKKNFPAATSKTDYFDCGPEGSIALKDEGRKFIWDVSENNHACETAREHPLAQAAFGALDKIRWTRSTGGKIIGNDENNHDSKEDGGGDNYVTGRYGPLGEDSFSHHFRKGRKRKRQT